AVWNAECDCKLVDFLFEQRGDGMQTSNGNWHKSAWTATESKLAGTEVQSWWLSKNCNATDLKELFYQLKKEYWEVKIICDKSRFGWNAEKSLATAEDNVWEKLIELQKWKTTSFPLYDEMADLVKGTYATG
ncbi:hypothetical protein L208DRAFT_1162019, partial [Tricholoma matsutake]